MQGLCESAKVPLPLVCQVPGARQEIEIGEMPLARPGGGAWGEAGPSLRGRECKEEWLCYWSWTREKKC